MNDVIFKDWDEESKHLISCFEELNKVNKRLLLDDVQLSFFLDSSFYPTIRTHINYFPRVKAKLLKMREVRRIKHYSRYITHKMGEATIIFLSFTNHILGQNEIFRYGRLIKCLLEEGGVRPNVLFVDPFTYPLNKLIRDTHNIYDYFKPKYLITAKKESDRLSKELNSIDEKCLKIIFGYKGQDLWRTKYKQAYKFFFSKDFIFITSLYYYLFKEMIELQRPKVVIITGIETILEKCLLAASYKYKIPSILIPHGFGSGRAYHKEEIRYIKYLFVMSEYEKSMLLNNDVEEDRIKVTGAIIYDDLFRIRREVKT